jgi:large subunit ribosomal protein L32e
MADEPTEKPAAPSAPRRAPSAKRPRGSAKPSTPPAPKAESPDAQTAPPRAPKRATLPPRLRTLLSVRDSIDDRRPIFGRQAANRYYRIGRDGAWRRPRGLQSKQRRHYGYRAKIVRIGYRSPARVRGLVPSGFAPTIVHNRDELDGLDASREAAIIARTVGTRKRLVLEEEARRLGIRVLNPIVKGETEE